MLAGLIGPWVFETINVPAEYTCQPPNVRLHGDFCGIPMSGIYVVWVIFAETVRSIGVLITGSSKLVDMTRIFPITFLGLAVILPGLSTLLVWLRPNGRRRAIFHWAACVLAAGAGLLVGLSSYPRLFYIDWGVWLFLAAAIAAAALELILLLKRQKPVQAA